MRNKGFCTDAKVGSDSFTHKMKALSLKIASENERNVPHERDNYTCPVTGLSVSIGPTFFEGGVSVIAEVETMN